jgi:hypothetical protein
MIYTILYPMIYTVKKYVCHIQVEELERLLKCKLPSRPRNAYLNATLLELFMVCPREELHQFLIGLYGDYIMSLRSSVSRYRD